MSRRYRPVPLLATLALAAAIVVLAGCSGAPAASSAGSTRTAPAAHPSMASLTARLGCTRYTPTMPPGLYTRQEGACTLHGQQIVLATFGDAAGQRAWVAAETTLGGVLVQGAGWAANAPAPADARTVTAKLGGRTAH
jgi:hypothetical protein